MPAALRPIDEPTLTRMVRYALATAMDVITLRPGARPLVSGLGPDRALNFRQLTCDDTHAVAEIVLAASKVPTRRAAEAGDSAIELFPLWEIPGKALVEMHVERAPGGLALRLELLRPLTDASEIALLEA
ncbi:MAG: hypothetical protein FJ091_14630 [Deltaproteobacteria bacterium]|nr:hypothetical protein [Deltaproteobacteria bacterium]